MTLSTVTWRQAVAAIAATLVALFAVMVVVRSDGLPAVDAASARATAWFVHQPTGRVVLVDGYGGRALASLDTGALGDGLTVAEGGPGVYLLNDATAEAQAIDSVELRLGTPFGLTALGAGRAHVECRPGRPRRGQPGRQRGQRGPRRRRTRHVRRGNGNGDADRTRRIDLVGGRQRTATDHVDDPADRPISVCPARS